jgi:PAS domain S-box-containing protein
MPPSENSLLLILVSTLALLLAGAAAYLVWRERWREKKARQALLEAEQRSAHIVECARDGIITIDESGVILTFNPAAAQMFGYRVEEAIGRNIAELVPAPDRRKDRNSYAQPMPGRDLAGRRSDGTDFPVDLMLSEIPVAGGKRYSAVVRDVTERRKSEEALAKERNFISAVLDNAGALCVVLDQEGRVVRFNRAIEELMNYSQGEIKGRYLWEIIALPQDFPEAERQIRALYRGPLPARTEDVWVTRQNTKRLIAWTHSGLFDDLKRLEFLISVGTDVTEVRGLEQQLVQARKMEAVGRLAGGVAHDFNNLLTAITGYSELVYQSLDEDDPARKDVEEIRKAGERAAVLTRQLLAFSRKQVLETRVFDLNTVVRDMNPIVRRVAGEAIRLDVKLNPEPVWIKADAAQMGQVLLNLVINARDAMQNGGELRVETSRLTAECDMTFAEQTLRAGSYALMQVSDSGCGMDQETLLRVFEPFFTTKEVGHGTGLGLATVYGIIRQSGGAVTVESELRRGTTFRILIPWTEPTGPGGAEESAGRQAAPAPPGNETVLVAEDDPEVRSLVKKALEGKGYRVLAAASGEEALALSGVHKGPIELLLTDVVMPVMPGPELARRMLERRPEMRVLFISGHSDATLASYGTRGVTPDIVMKPISPELLAHRVRQVMDGNIRQAGSTS